MKDLQPETEESEVLENFELAVQLVKSLPQKGSFQPSYAEAARIYSYFKQAKFGPCNIPKPGFWDYINRAKWDAWSGLGDLPREKAMQNYVDEIKVLFVRVKELEEFQEREHEFAKFLIPFCKANHIPMSRKLMDMVKKEDKMNDHVEMPSIVSSQANISVSNGATKTGNDILTDDESELETNGHEHSILLEKTHESKNVKFELNEESIPEGPLGVSSNESIEIVELDKSKDETSSDEKEDEDEEEEIFCDPLDPSEMPMEKESVTESSLTTTDSGVTFNETVITNKPVVRKRSKVIESSSDSHDPVSRELKQPYHKPRRGQYKRTGFSNGGISRSYHVRRHKRLDENNGRDNGHRNNGNHHHQHQRSHPPAGTHSVSHPSHSSNHPSQQSQGNNPPSDHSDSTDSYVSSGSYSNDTIGLKIVNSLERMEDNMQSIIERLDSIEETVKVVTKPKVPWWQQYMPSKTMMIWTFWPIIVNILFFLYWKRFRRQKIKKC
ncbi:acyl-CoA-binding domain-containing protein 4-like [Clytia hemisphaerica]|uniref:acyl-CoA-binding domain-containing protein 4-like n=1 Tax=Clytia hemisphaerica TaxID=252671 RepID=UPI0034D58BE9|eukprot:TCONS_00054985-protein